MAQLSYEKLYDRGHCFILGKHVVLAKVYTGPDDVLPLVPKLHNTQFLVVSGVPFLYRHLRACAFIDEPFLRNPLAPFAVAPLSHVHRRS